jgi:hypothetical protein
MEDNLHAIHCSANQRKQGLISEGVLLPEKTLVTCSGHLSSEIEERPRYVDSTLFMGSGLYTSCFAVWCQVPLVA